MTPSTAGPAVDVPLGEDNKIMGSESHTVDSVTSSRARSRSRNRSRSQSRSQIPSISSTPIPKLATRVDIPRIRINTATPLSQTQTTRRSRSTHLRTISVDTIIITPEERPTPPSSPDEGGDLEQYPPRHPVPSMQAAFEESMFEQLSSARGEVGGPGASANWRSSLQRSSVASSRASRGSIKKPKCHPLEKLVAQVAFGVYLLHQGLAISENEVVRILQGHVNDMDDFLSTTTRDFDKATREIKHRTQHLKFPIDMGPPAATIFENMLRDKTFRAELLENNTKVEQIIRRTVRMSTKALKDIGEGLKAVRHLARYLSSLRDGWRSENLVRVYGAMVQNVEQWYRCLIGLQAKGTDIADRLQKLKSVIFEIDKRAGVASRADVKSTHPPTKARISARKSAMLATKPLPETPTMTPVILPIQKPDPSTFDLAGSSTAPEDSLGLAPSVEIRSQPTRRNSLRKNRAPSSQRGRRGSVQYSTSKGGASARGHSPVSPVSTMNDKSRSVLRRRSTKRSSQMPSPVSPLTERKRDSLWPKVRQPSTRLATHDNRPISFLLEATDESSGTPPYKVVQPLRINKKHAPLPVPNPYESCPPEQLRKSHALPRTSSGQPPITHPHKDDPVEFYGHGSVENLRMLKVPKETKAPRIQTPEIPTPLHFDFTFDQDDSRSSVSPLSMLPPTNAPLPLAGRLPEAPSPPTTPPPSEPSASMIEALHPVHPGSHYPIPISPHTLPRPPSSEIHPINSSLLVSPVLGTRSYEDPLSLGPLVGSGDNDIDIQGEPITLRRLQEVEAEKKKGGVRRLLYDNKGVRRCGKCKLGTRVFGGVKGDVVLDEEERGRARDKDRARNERRFEKEERKLQKDLRVGRPRDRSEERRLEMERLREEGKCEVM